MRRKIPRLALAAGASLLLLAPASWRHHYLWGGDYADYLHFFELISLLLSQGLGLWVLWRALCRVERGAIDLRTIWRGSSWILLASLFVLPFMSDDVFAYDLRGRILSLHGGNPYVDVATQYAGVDPLVDPANRWHSYPNPYGPLFTLCQGGIAWVSSLLPGVSAQVQQLSSLLFYRLLAAIALLGIARQLVLWAPDAKAAQRVALCVLWNPLLWLEGVVHAHNDLLLGAALVFALSSLLRERFLTAALWLWLGVQIKFISLALGPLFLALALRRKRFGSFALGNLLGLLPFAALGFYFWSGPGGLDWLSRQGQLHCASLQLLVAQLFAAPFEIVQKLGMLLAVLFAFWAAWRCQKLQEAPLWSARLLFVLILLGLSWAGPWYHLWWLALCWNPRLLPGAPARSLMLTTALSYGISLGARDLGRDHEWTQWALTMAIPALLFLAWKSKPLPTAPPPASSSAPVS
ncbi:MAG: hypothetical protein CSA62_06460 [Planctomycetota bacterium]|nr:MAG: hypothetical protein CSA62_06460 [Planctomycetota bacterium]